MHHIQAYMAFLALIPPLKICWSRLIKFLYLLNDPHLKLYPVLQMARTKSTARKSTGGRAARRQLSPHEPRPEPTVEERLRAELA
jgi:hypothetical protein